MIRKEIWAHLLAYNMIRRIISDSAKKHNINPRRISFKHAVQTLHAYQKVFDIRKKLGRTAVYQHILNSIAQIQVMNRPNRFEPRAKKRRPKQLDRLMLPRNIAKQQILKKLAA